MRELTESEMQEFTRRLLACNRQEDIEQLAYEYQEEGPGALIWGLVAFIAWAAAIIIWLWVFRPTGY